MKIVVLEYVSGGGMRQETMPHALAREGETMLRALVGDLLAQEHGLELIILRDDRLPWSFPGEGIQAVMVTAKDAFQTVWRDCISHCDAVWPIAPETGGILEQLCLDVEAAGKTLLTCPASAVRLAASKLNTARRLAEFGLPVVDTGPLDSDKLPAWAAFVIKPDDGVGCEGALIISDASQLQALAGTEALIVQPLLAGESVSLSVLFANGRARLLSCNRQWIDRVGGGFVLRGVTVNAIADADGSLQALVEGIARAVPELWGYAGIDLVLTDGGPVILEINPRLTTSYAGLRSAVGENPAAAVLRLLTTGQLHFLPASAGKPVQIDLGVSSGD